MSLKPYITRTKISIRARSAGYAVATVDGVTTVFGPVTVVMHPDDVQIDGASVSLEEAFEKLQLQA